jgi:hypothetical protein
VACSTYYMCVIQIVALPLHQHGIIRMVQSKVCKDSEEDTVSASDHAFQCFVPSFDSSKFIYKPILMTL